MAYRGENDFSAGPNTDNNPDIIKLNGDETQVDLPDSSFVRDSDMVRDGMDLVLETPEGTILIESYFAAEPAPDLVAPDGSTLTPDLVHSFSSSPAEYAQGLSMMDISPVGAVEEFAGEATVTRADGSVDAITIGTEIYEGDIIETNEEGAVNILFVDETTFAVSEDARMAIDEYVYDPATDGGVQNFSVLKGVFVFTSGLIGREDPDDVMIDTPVGSIGIRGTIIAGDVDKGEITVVEGAIVLRDFNGNEMTLANQFETGKFHESGNRIVRVGELSANEVNAKFESVSGVSPQLFSSINDAAAEQGAGENGPNTPAEQQGKQGNEPAEERGERPAENKADGSVDQNNDNQVDGSVDDGTGETEQGEGNAEGGEQPKAEVKPQGEQQLQGAEDVQGTKPPLPPQDTQFGDDPSGLPPTAKKAALHQQQQQQQNEGSDPVNNTAETANNDSSANTVGNDGTTGADGTQPPPPPEVLGTAPPPPPPPGFGIQFINKPPVLEESMGANIAVIQGVNGVIGAANDIVINGKFGDIVDIIDLGGGQFGIQLQSGESLDYDFLKHTGMLDASDHLNVSFTVTSTDGETFNGGTKIQVLAVDEDPDHNFTAQPETFAAVEVPGSGGTTWTYNFNRDFNDQDFGDNLTFELSAATITALNSLEVDGPGGNNDILQNGVGGGLVDAGSHAGNGWTFNETTGELTLYFHDNFEIAPGTFENIVIGVDAKDDGGTYALSGTGIPGFATYNFKAYKSNAGISTLSNLLDGTPPAVIFDDQNGTDNTLTVGSSNRASGKKVFMGNDNDTLNILDATGNIFYLENGNNQVVLNNMGVDVAQNTVIGGENKDTFTFMSDNTFENKILGMDGDDDFIIDVTNTGLMAEIQVNAPDPDILMDGGNNFFRAGDTLGDEGHTDFFYFSSAGTDHTVGRGDSLVLGGAGAGNIDFTSIHDSFFRNIERIDANNGMANIITLEYSDVLALTDHHDTLIINLDGNDTLNLSGPDFDLTNFDLIEDDLTINDARAGDSPENRNYDVYTNGEVTLLISDASGAANINFDSTGVTV